MKFKYKKYLIIFFLILIAFRGGSKELKVAVLKYGSVNWELDVLNYHGLDEKFNLKLKKIQMTNKDASHRQTRYAAAPPLEHPQVLPLPEATDDIEQAKSNLSEYGLCFLTGVLSESEVAMIGDKLERQAEAERQLGELAPIGSDAPKQGISNLVNKGRVFLDLVEREEVDELAITA